MEAARAAQILRYSAGEAFRPVGELYEQAITGGPVYTVHRPVGVVLDDRRQQPGGVELQARHGVADAGGGRGNRRGGGLLPG